jgi:hypothetical protein
VSESRFNLLELHLSRWLSITEHNIECVVRPLVVSYTYLSTNHLFRTGWQVACLYAAACVILGMAVREEAAIGLELHRVFQGELETCAWLRTANSWVLLTITTNNPLYN